MKAILLPALFSFALSTLSSAQTCREVVRDASGRIVQTIDRQKSAGGSVQATTRDASGRIIGTTTNPNAGGSAQTHYRDASGRRLSQFDHSELLTSPLGTGADSSLVSQRVQPMTKSHAWVTQEERPQQQH